MGGGGVTAGLARERAHLPVTARAREAKTARGGALNRGRGGGVCRLQPRGRRVCQNSSTFPPKRALGRQPAPPPPYFTVLGICILCDDAPGRASSFNGGANECKYCELRTLHDSMYSDVCKHTSWHQQRGVLP